MQQHQLKDLSTAIAQSDVARRKKISIEKKETSDKWNCHIDINADRCLAIDSNWNWNVENTKDQFEVLLILFKLDGLYWFVIVSKIRYYRYCRVKA